MLPCSTLVDVFRINMSASKIELNDVISCAEQGFNYAKTADFLGVNKSSVVRFAEKHNIVFKGKRGRFSDDPNFISKVIKMYDDGLMGDDIAEELCINRKTVFSILGENHRLRTTTENYNIKGRTIRSSAFSDAGNDRLAAYFYGWLVTDGCLLDNGSVELSLQSDDREVLIRLKEFLDCSANICDKTITKDNGKFYKSSRLAFRDNQIVKDLKVLGMEPRKSCKEKLPTFDWKYGKTAKDFWQGVIEGDGCIADYDKCGLVNLVGSQELLEGFREFCEDVIGTKKNVAISKVKTCRDEFRSIRYNNNDARLICEYLYTDTVFKLDRKYLKALSVISKETVRISKRKNYIYLIKKSGKYEARCPIKNGKMVQIGTFNTIEEALLHRDDFTELYKSLAN